MAQVLAISEQVTTLAQIQEKLGLNLTTNNQFFTEWLEPLPELTDIEKERLD